MRERRKPQHRNPFDLPERELGSLTQDECFACDAETQTKKKKKKLRCGIC